MLSDLNDGIEPSKSELEWVLGSVKQSSAGTIKRSDLRQCVPCIVHMCLDANERLTAQCNCYLVRPPGSA